MSRSAVPATQGSSNSVEVLYTLLCALTMTYYKADTRHETQQPVCLVESEERSEVYLQNLVS